MKIQERWRMVLDKVSFALLCVLMADCCITGAGRLIEIGSLGGRMVLFFFLCLSAVPAMLCNWKNLLKNRFVQYLLCFLGVLVIQAVRGVMVGNHMGILKTDVKGYLYFAMVPVSLCVLTDKKRILTLMKVMVYASAFLSCLAVAFVILYAYNLDLFQKLAQYVVPENGSTTGMMAFTALQGKQMRVFCYSGLYLLCSCAFSCYFVVSDEGSGIKWQYCLITALNLLVLLISFTRSIYLAAFIAVVSLVVFLLFAAGKGIRKKVISFFGVSLLMLAVLLAGVDAITGESNLQYGATRILLTMESAEESSWITEPATEPDEPQYNQTTIESDQLRNMTVEEYKKYIRRNPLFGNGLGVYLECREDGYGEYFYLDMISKMGIVGLICFLAPMLNCLFYIVNGIRKGEKEVIMLGIWIVPLLGLMGYSYFNPYMNAALGVLFYSAVIAVASWYDNQRQKRNVRGELYEGHHLSRWFRHAAVPSDKGNIQAAFTYL